MEALLGDLKNQVKEGSSWRRSRTLRLDTKLITDNQSINQPTETSSSLEKSTMLRKMEGKRRTTSSNIEGLSYSGDGGTVRRPEEPS